MSASTDRIISKLVAVLIMSLAFCLFLYILLPFHSNSPPSDFTSPSSYKIAALGHSQAEGSFPSPNLGEFGNLQHPQFGARNFQDPANVLDTQHQSPSQGAQGAPGKETQGASGKTPLGRQRILAEVDRRLDESKRRTQADGTSWEADERQYGVVVDAGSSGSRAFVYTWPVHSGRRDQLLHIQHARDPAHPERIAVLKV